MDLETLTIETHGPEQTESVGRALAALLPRGAVVALRGELASGKTCLVRGMARHFGAGDRVHSPTFTLVNEYGDSPKLYHVDLFRLEAKDLADLGYEELFDGDDVCVVEWAERAEEILPKQRVDVGFEHRGGDARRQTFTDAGVLPAGWRDVLRAAGCRKREARSQPPASSL